MPPLAAEPLLSMLGDERVIREVRISGDHAIEFFDLSLSECRYGIKTPDPLEQTLSAKHFVHPRDHTLKAIADIKQGGIHLGHLNIPLQQLH